MPRVKPSLRSVLILSCCIIFAGVLASAQILSENVKGICWEDGSFLNDDQLLEIAISQARSRYNAHLQLLVEREAISASDTVLYDSNDAFLAAQPKCCSVVNEEDLREEQVVPVFPRMLGKYRAYIKVGYEIGPQISESHFLIVDNCGNVSSGYLD